MLWCLRERTGARQAAAHQRASGSCPSASPVLSISLPLSLYLSLYLVACLPAHLQVQLSEPIGCGEAGVYLALTGARIGVEDALFAGAASHYVQTHRIDKLQKANQSLTKANPLGRSYLLVMFKPYSSKT